MHPRGVVAALDVSKHAVLAYARQRKQFGKAIAEFQLIQAMLADSKTEIYAGHTMGKAQRAHDARP